MSRAPPSVSAPPPEVDAKLMGLGINIDQRKRLMIAARLGIGPGNLVTGLPGPSNKGSQAQPRARSRSPTELPGPAGSSGYTAAQAAATEREKRRREMERKKDDDDEMDLAAFMGGCSKAAKKAAAEKERQAKAAAEKAKEEALNGELRERRRREQLAANAAAAKGGKIFKTAPPTQPLEEEVLAMLRMLKFAGSSAATSAATEVCTCGQPFVGNAKFCSECGAKRTPPQETSSRPTRHFREGAAAPIPEEPRRETSEEVQRKEERRELRREEKRRKREDKARQREAAEGEVEHDEADEDSSDEASDRERSTKGATSAKTMDGEMRRFWDESVKGRVSNVNKGFSDADLERRFQLAAGGPTALPGSEKLMSEEEVLAMLRKPKVKR